MVTAALTNQDQSRPATPSPARALRHRARRYLRMIDDFTAGQHPGTRASA